MINCSRFRTLAISAALPIFSIVTVELVLRLSKSYNQYAFAPPSAIARSFLHELVSGSLVEATLQTLSAAAIGLFFGTVVGIVVGLLLGLIPPIDRLMEVTLEVLRPVPFIVLIPMIMMMLGVGLKMEATAIAIGTFWPNLIMSRAAVRQVEPRLLEVSKVLGLRPEQAALKIVLPAALPRILVAFRLALGFSLLGAVAVEITANPYGIGRAMMFAQQALRPDTMFAYLLWTAILGWCMNGLVSLIETRLLWRYQLQTSM